MNILIIEDEEQTLQSIKLSLERESFAVDTSKLGASGLSMARVTDYDVILLDVMLPDMEGYDIVSVLRSEHIETPVLILSGLSNMDDKLKALGLGADDYVTKPFERRELVARIKALARRRIAQPSVPSIKTGGLTIDFGRRRVRVDGVTIALTVKEYAILELLARNIGSALGKEILMNHLYGDKRGRMPAPRIVDVFVCKLRRKLMPNGKGDNYIHTVWGQGYILPEIPIR